MLISIIYSILSFLISLLISLYLTIAIYKFNHSRKIDYKKNYRVSIVHADCESEATRLENLIKNALSNIDKLFVLPCCASLAVHAGPGALAIAIQEYTALT